MATEKLRFAMPVGRVDGTDFTAIAGRITLARDLRQTAGEAAAEGLEIKLGHDGAPAARKVYCLLDGILKYDPARKQALRLEFEPEIVDYTLVKKGRLEGLNRTCEQIQCVLYDAVDSGTLKSRLVELIQGAYQAYVAARAKDPNAAAPRVLKGKLTATLTVETKTGGKLQKSKRRQSFVILDKLRGLADDAARLALLEEALADVLTRKADFKISAGDCIADALETEAGKTSQFSITMEDAAGNRLNPVYLLHLVLGKRSEVEISGATGIDDLLANPALAEAERKKRVHPLLLALAGKAWGPFAQNAGVYSLKSAAPPLFVPSSTAAPAEAPQKIARQASVSTFGGYPESKPVSKYEWRIADDLYFKFRNRIDFENDNEKDESYFTFGKPAWNQVLGAWKEFGNLINKVAPALTIPCEVSLAFLTHESGGNARACGIEPAEANNPEHPLWDYFKLTHVPDRNTKNETKDKLLQLLDWAAPATGNERMLTFLHDNLTLSWVSAADVTVTKSKDGSTVTIASKDGKNTLSIAKSGLVVQISYSLAGAAKTYELPIRNDRIYRWKAARLGPTVPADYNTVIDADRHASYTWQDLLDDLAQQSQGLWLKVSPGIKQTLIGTARDMLQKELDAELAKKLGVTLPDLTDGSAIFKWLLDAENSLLTGILYLCERNDEEEIGFNLPQLASAYNSGSTKLWTTKCSRTKVRVPNPFHLCTWDNYMLGEDTSLAPCYNAAVRLFERHDLLGAGKLEIPKVRFQ